MNPPVYAKSGIGRGSDGEAWATPLSGQNPAGKHYKHKRNSPYHTREKHPSAHIWHRSGVDQAEPAHITADESEQQNSVGRTSYGHNTYQYTLQLELMVGRAGQATTHTSKHRGEEGHA